jgi:hypothetical protein
MNAETRANDFEGMFLSGIVPPLYDGKGGLLYRIGNGSWGHRLIRQAFLMGVDAVLLQDRCRSLNAI